MVHKSYANSSLFFVTLLVNTEYYCLICDELFMFHCLRQSMFSAKTMNVVAVGVRDQADRLADQEWLPY